MNKLVEILKVLPGKLGTESHQFILLLGITNDEHDRLKKDFPSQTKKQVEFAIHKWIQKRANHCLDGSMKEKLLKALAEVKRDDLHTMVRDGDWTDIQFVKIAQCISSEWKELGIFLGVDKPTLDRIEMDNFGNATMQTVKALAYWRDKQYSDSIAEALNLCDRVQIRNELFQALEDCGLSNIVEELKESYELENLCEEVPSKKRRLSVDNKNDFVNDTGKEQDRYTSTQIYKPNSTKCDDQSKRTYEILYDRTRTYDAKTALNTSEGKNVVAENKCERNAEDISESTDSIRQGPIKNLELRKYQEELSVPALEGHNTIVIAPTGTGKTHVAMKIIQKLMSERKDTNPKVVVLVPQIALANQHCSRFEEYLDFRVKAITSDSMQTKTMQSLSVWLKSKDILIVTAQLLFNALMSEDVKMSDLSLIVFDECHHTHDNHVYNQIMNIYMDRKYDNNSRNICLPQIVGLTASIGVGRAKQLYTAKLWVQTIMANLDATKIATVEKNLEELSRYAIVAISEIVKSSKRENEAFGDEFTNILKNIEHDMQESTHANAFGESDSILRFTPTGGSEQYTQWLSKLKDATAVLCDTKSVARRFFVTCKDFLEIYHKTLIIYADSRVKDALTFLNEELEKLKEQSNLDDTGSKLLDLFIRKKDFLERCNADSTQKNPKLEELKKILLNANVKPEDVRCIIFAKTRDLVKALYTWMKDSEDLAMLEPVKFVGSKASFEKGGITKYDQSEILKGFREGRYKVLIATSIAEEGLDFVDCNLVIRYDHVTNEIGMVQARGRGRTADSKHFLVSGHEKNTAEKEKINLIRESIMNKAIEDMKVDLSNDSNRFRRKQEEIQKSAKKKREIQVNEAAARKHPGKVFKLKCYQCSNYICSSLDIRVFDKCYHAVINPEIIENLCIKPKPTGKKFEDSKVICGTGKMYCSQNSCLYDLGNVSCFKKVHFPIVKIASFTVEDPNGKNKKYKKWKDIPFPVSSIEDEDVQRMTGVVNLEG